MVIQIYANFIIQTLYYLLEMYARFPMAEPYNVLLEIIVYKLLSKSEYSVTISKVCFQWILTLWNMAFYKVLKK